MAMVLTRSEHLDLCIPTHCHPKIGRMPLLRSLTLAFLPTDKVFTYDAPKLRTVILRGYVIPKVIVPWAQLTCLTLEYVGTEMCASVLRQTTNLAQCTLHFYCHPLEYEVHLQTSGQPVDGYLSSFIVPALSRLDLQEAFLGGEPIAALELFIAKSGCRLQEVHITGMTRTKHNDLYRQVFPSIRIFHHVFPNVIGGTIDSEDDSEAESISETEKE
ncbi:hypothetical protein MSAN_00088500 [Mycena sanguinolenta]|uniref:Uncharacterized protein n=1 Tax=Mycena sanguinolenta TaxID=230812 RepID=A0A8H6ZJL4_9AGAR|nr:hypothetical protein MSAN_00088500 [Mycena sanguinolenta]